jgi:hypothetical protein
VTLPSRAKNNSELTWNRHKEQAMGVVNEDKAEIDDREFEVEVTIRYTFSIAAADEEAAVNLANSEYLSSFDYSGPEGAEEDFDMEITEVGPLYDEWEKKMMAGDSQ